jgi:hypothetical protein
MKRIALGVLVLAGVLAFHGASEGYHYYPPAANGGLTHWAKIPVHYLVNDKGGPGIPKEQLRGVVENAFGAWQGIQTAQVSGEFAGYTSAAPVVGDGITIIDFDALPPGVLGVTYTLRQRMTGEMIDADVSFATGYPWSLSPAGEPGRYDLRAVVTHELGHLFGLSHSMLGETERTPTGGYRPVALETIMFPIAFSPGSAAQQLGADDAAGISGLYPSSTFLNETGRLEGQVQRGGRPVRHAHVVAFDLTSGDLVARFTETDGRFSIAGLRPGPKVVRVEPLNDAAAGSFGFRDDEVDADFTVTTSERLVFVSAGHSADAGTITVEAR